MARLKPWDVDGLGHIEWENPDAGSGEYWLVALGNTAESKPRTFRLGYTGTFAEMEEVPFSSAIATRYRKLRKEEQWRFVRIATEAVAICFLAVFVISAVLGLLQFRTVVSGSMAGTFEVGDVLVAVSPSIVEPEVGKIVVFHYYNVQRTEFIADFSHRIISGNESEGWVTKGDANESADIGTVLKHDISGVVLFWIPKLGFALQPQFVLGIVILILLFVTIGPDIRDFVNQRRR